MGIGILLFFVNVIVTRRGGDRAANDPWVADTPEWYTTRRRRPRTSMLRFRT